jgi:hypothetical protein
MLTPQICTREKRELEKKLEASEVRHLQKTGIGFVTLARVQNIENI